jgi:hypothetical protein
MTTQPNALRDAVTHLRRQVEMAELMEKGALTGNRTIYLTPAEGRALLAERAPDHAEDALAEVERRISAARNEHWQGRHVKNDGGSLPYDYGKHDAWTIALRIIHEVLAEEGS